MKLISKQIIYENDLPQLTSRQSMFPSICECDDGTVIATHVIGEAFESVDCTTHISFSTDGGNTWSAPEKVFSGDEFNVTMSDCMKVTALKSGRIAGVGYGFIRENPQLPEANPLNGGLLEDIVFYTYSDDRGRTWAKPEEIKCSWGRHVEASAPIVEISDNTFITPITGFADWNGNMTGKMCGRLLCSADGGKTWNDDSVCMDFSSDDITCFEQRICKLDSGTLVCIGWNENIKTGERYPNHYTFSIDNGKTWSNPQSTGIMGQASSVCALGKEKILAIHAVRRDTDNPGIYGYIVDFGDKEWNITEEHLLWKPDLPVNSDTKMAEIFSYLKFGQPSALKLRDGNIMMCHWYCENGQYKTIASRFEI